MNLDELEHDSLEDDKGPTGSVAPPRAEPQAPPLREVREQLRQQQEKDGRRKPWCRHDNPLIWVGDVSDLYE